MKGKNYSIPFGMLFKKYHCSKCGEKLEKERTHRIVTKDDLDYYQYHEHGTFPRCDYDVYSYQFKCPSCGAIISFDEQCIIEKIQKKLGHFVLTYSEIKEHYQESKEANNKRVLYRNIFMQICFNLLAFALIYFSSADRTPTRLTTLFLIFIILTIVTVFRVIKKHQGNYKNKLERSYSYEKESQLNRLHDYCKHNKEMIDASEKCYCFYCKSIMESNEIEKYIDEEQTALCPKCGIDSIIPDSIDENLDEKIISEMSEYWF